MLATDTPLTLRLSPEDAPAGVGEASERLVVDRLWRLTVPLVAAHGERLRVIASANLWRVRGGVCVSTAAHVFDAGVQVGDLGIADPQARRVAWLGARGARLRLHSSADVALIALADSRDLPSAWRVLPAGLLGSPAVSSARYVVAGWPAAQTRWTGERLSARAVVCFTTGAAFGAHTYRYARIADRHDGVPISTPALDGMSGAMLWRIRRDDTDAHAQVLQPAGMQVSFVHNRFMRCEPAEALAELLARAAA